VAKLQEAPLGQGQGLAHALDAVWRDGVITFLQELPPETNLGTQQRLTDIRGPNPDGRVDGVVLVFESH
jgi:hypothetical protein